MNICELCGKPITGEHATYRMLNESEKEHIACIPCALEKAAGFIKACSVFVKAASQRRKADK